MRLILAAVLLTLSSVPAAAQDERIGVGGSVTYVNPRSDELTRAPVTVWPLIRLQPGEGWGLAGALNWYDTDVANAVPGADGNPARLEVKPLVGGVGYTIRNGRLRTTSSVVAGPAWNRLKIDGRDDLDEVSFVVRPGAGVSVRVAPRIDLTAFGGYVFNRPKFSIETPGGTIENRWTADAVVLSGGVVVAIF